LSYDRHRPPKVKRRKRGGAIDIVEIGHPNLNEPLPQEDLNVILPDPDEELNEPVVIDANSEEEELLDV
jgi:hypothetical protein